MDPVSPVAFAALLLVALLAGLGAGVILARGRERAAVAAAGAADAARAQAVQAAQAAEVALATERERSRAAQAELAQGRDELARLRTRADALHDDLGAARDAHTALRERTDAERAHAGEKLRLLEDAKAALSDQFRNLANDILEEKAKRFADQNQQNLGQLLDPLRTQLSEFKGRVEQVYDQEGKDRSALAEQVRQLMALNQTLSRDAANLTSALKGQAKTQGNWGELILERVLEAAGLRKGHEYRVQDSQRTEDGRLLQPDVVIELPEQRRLVVDAKVSLVDYERVVAAGSDDERAVAVRQHLASVRRHVDGLSGKRYEALYGLQSLDMVVMFVPIEPAFMMAVTHDEALFMDAWQRNVLLVSPSTLLFVVRTIAHLWRQEAQRTNAQEIAKRGAELYDRLTGFVEELQKVGAKLRDAQAAYDGAEKKLGTGRGNVIRQAEMLRALGVKASKSLPAPLVEAAGDADGEAGAGPGTPAPGGLPLFDEPPSLQ